MHVKRVSLACKTSKLGSVYLTSIGRVNGIAIARHPLANLGENPHRLLGDRAIRLGTNVQEIVAAVARTRDEISDDGFRALPIVIGAVVTPTVVQRHAAFPRTRSLLRYNFLLR